MSEHLARRPMSASPPRRVLRNPLRLTPSFPLSHRLKIVVSSGANRIRKNWERGAVAVGFTGEMPKQILEDFN